jgi:hypothetical protein
MKRFFLAATFAGMCALFGGCATNSDQQLLETGKSQVELRQIESRAFDTTDREKTLRTIMATLQDLGFVIDKADATLGTVTATRLSTYGYHASSMRMTVTVRAHGDKQLLVRASAQLNEQTVLDPVAYQQFFAALSKAMFLGAQQVD